MTLTVIHVALSLALFYSQFCRSVKTDHTTHAPVLVAFYGLTAASIFSVFAPIILPGWRPSWDTLALLSSVIVVQLVTSRYWHHGAPSSFCKEVPHDQELG